MIYLAIAYEYGYFNLNQYTVAIGTDKEQVLARAELEPGERASKYGVEVLEYPDSDFFNVAGCYDNGENAVKQYQQLYLKDDDNQTDLFGSEPEG